MRAAFYTRQGEAAEVIRIGEQPRPEPGPGEVRVRLGSSGVNPSDWKMRRGGGGRARVGARVLGGINQTGPPRHTRMWV
ncbi:hypothetical protein ACEN8K_24730, partial [Variovorax sp. CT11-76]